MSYTNFESNSSLAGNCGFLLFKRTNNFAAVGSGYILGQIQSQGFDGVQFQTASFINISATGAPAVNIPSKIQFYSSTGTATHLAMSIGQDGQVTLTDPFVNQATLIVHNNQSTPNINLRTANATPTNAPHMHFTRSHAGTGAVIANDDLGRLEFFGFQGGTAREAAEIKSVAQTVNGTNGVSSYLSFSTVPTTYAAMAERMRISADGNVTISTPVSGTALTVTGATGSFAADFTGTNAGGISVGQSNGGASSYQAVQTSVDVEPVYFNVFKNRAGGIIVANDVIYQLNAFGFADTNRVAALQRIISTNIGANYVSGAFDWWTTSTAGATNQRMVLNADGLVTINAPAVTGQALTVNGFNGTANYAFVSQASVSAGLYASSRFLNASTTAGSGCRLDVAVNQQPLTTGGETFVRFVNEGVQAISVGLNTATQQYVMGSGSTLAANPFFTYTIANNQINLPLQISFGAFLQPGLANQTGAGGAPDVAFNVVTSNVGGAYNAANGRVTAPVDGKYLIGANVTVDAISAAMTVGNLEFWRYNAAGVPIASYAYNYINPAAVKMPTDICSFQGHIVIPMNATDYVTVKCILANGAGDTAGYTGFGARETSIYGQLLS